MNTICKECGKSTKSSTAKRCHNCNVIYRLGKDYSASKSEECNLKEQVFDTVNEIHESKYGHRLSEGFNLLGEE
jgi:tRNA(Ile2) C34 agmatinyltransferase TiaS